MDRLNGAELLVRCLKSQEVEYIFGMPCSKIDAIYNVLLDFNIKLIVCQHEQNPTFTGVSRQSDRN